MAEHGNPFEQGAEAYRRGKKAAEACPYQMYSKGYVRWVSGWQSAQQKAAQAEREAKRDRTEVAVCTQ